MFTVLLFYKYVAIADPEALTEAQRALCRRLELKGRVLVAEEGINATLEGTDQAIDAYIRDMKSDSRFADIHFKKSIGTGTAFPKLSIKVRTEIVTGSLGSADINPAIKTGAYLAPEELHTWFEEKREFYIVDMRNDYEYASGHFAGFVPSGMKHFKDLPSVLPRLRHLKDKTVVTVCTGGVRCEKASGFLVENGFQDVYQLHGGIVSYMEKYPNQHFLGKLYVFDGRILTGFNTEDEAHVVVGKCEHCKIESERYHNCAYDDCHRHYIVCPRCEQSGGGYCGWGCRIKDMLSQ